jgi:anti-sigma B factor antagonist
LGIEVTSEDGDAVYAVTTAEVDSASSRAFAAELDVAVSHHRSIRALCPDADPVPGLVLDLAQVRFLDSKGLQALLSAHRTVAEEGGRLVLANAQGIVLRMLEVSGALDHINGTSADGAR